VSQPSSMSFALWRPTYVAVHRIARVLLVRGELVLIQDGVPPVWIHQRARVQFDELVLSVRVHYDLLRGPVGAWMPGPPAQGYGGRVMKCVTVVYENAIRTPYPQCGTASRQPPSGDGVSPWGARRPWGASNHGKDADARTVPSRGEVAADVRRWGCVA
jgi:hypothetical protein